MQETVKTETPNSPLISLPPHRQEMECLRLGIRKGGRRMLVFGPKTTCANFELAHTQIALMFDFIRHRRYSHLIMVLILSHNTLGLTTGMWIGIRVTNGGFWSNDRTPGKPATSSTLRMWRMNSTLYHEEEKTIEC